MSNKDYTDPATHLTLREQQIACLIAACKTNQDIAQEIGCSVKTYDTHRAHILKKLGLKNSVDIARWVYRMGWVDLEGNVSWVPKVIAKETP